MHLKSLKPLKKVTCAWHGIFSAQSELFKMMKRNRRRRRMTKGNLWGSANKCGIAWNIQFFRLTWFSHLSNLLDDNMYSTYSGMLLSTVGVYLARDSAMLISRLHTLQSLMWPYWDPFHNEIISYSNL